MKIRDTASIWAVHGSVPYSYESGPEGKRQTYHCKKNVTCYVAANDIDEVLAAVKTEMPDLIVWSINHQSRNQNGFAIIVSEEVVVQ